MGRHINILGALLFLVLSFHLSVEKVSEVATINNETFKEFREDNVIPIVENLKLHRIRDQCNTQGDTWYCCLVIESKVNFTACISIGYLREEIGLEMNVTIDGLVIFHEKVSVRNPPPICFHIPYLEKIANVCFRVHDLDDSNNTISGCVEFEIHLEGLRVFKLHVGCFKFPMLWFRKEIRYGVKMVEHTFG